MKMDIISRDVKMAHEIEMWALKAEHDKDTHLNKLLATFGGKREVMFY